MHQPQNEQPHLQLTAKHLEQTNQWQTNWFDNCCGWSGGGGGAGDETQRWWMDEKLGDPGETPVRDPNIRNFPLIGYSVGAGIPNIGCVFRHLRTLMVGHPPKQPVRALAHLQLHESEESNARLCPPSIAFPASHPALLMDPIIS